MRQDQHEAARLYRRAAEQRYPGAYFNLSLAIEEELGGLERNDEESNRLCNKDCDRGGFLYVFFFFFIF